MNQELLIGCLPPLGWVCWWLGGRGIPPFKKSWRRDVWPLIIAWIAWYWAAMSIEQAVVGAVAMDLVHRQGYGESLPIWRRALTVSLLGVPVLLFGARWYWWPVISIWFGVTYVLSRKKNSFTWDWVEASTGLWQGIALVTALK